MKRKRSSKEVVTVGNVKVKIYTRTRRNEYGTRQIYEVSDYTGGTRRLRSFSNHAEARQEAEKVARQLSTGDALAGAMRNADAASYGRAIELLRPTGASLELAAAVYAKCFEILGGDDQTEAATFYARHGANRITSKLVAEVVAELVAASVARGLSARHIGDLRLRLGRFAESFAVNISSVTTSDVARWLDGLKLAPVTVNNFRRLLHVLFAFAETRGYTFKGSNPVAGVKPISTTGGEIEIFTPDEFAKLLGAASPDFLPFVAIGGLAGLRAAEIQRIEWPDGRLTAIQIDQAVVSEATKRGLRATALPDIAARARQNFKLVGGVPQAFAADGQTARVGKDGYTPMTLAEWVEALVSDAPHLFEANAGGGAAGSGSGGAGNRSGKNPFAPATWNLTEQMQLQKTDPAVAARLKAAA